MNQEKLIQLARRKVNGRQHSRINEGRLKVQTPNGFVLVEDGDYILSGDVKDQNFIIPKHTMDFLLSTAVEAPPAKKESAPKEPKAPAAASEAPAIVAPHPVSDLEPGGSVDIQDKPSDASAPAAPESAPAKKSSKKVAPNGSAPKKRGRKPKASGTSKS